MDYWFDMDGVIVKYEPDAYKGINPPYLRKKKHSLLRIAYARCEDD